MPVECRHTLTALGVIRLSASHEMQLFRHYSRLPTCACHDLRGVENAIPFDRGVCTVDGVAVLMVSHKGVPSYTLCHTL